MNNDVDKNKDVLHTVHIQGDGTGTGQSGDMSQTSPQPPVDPPQTPALYNSMPLTDLEIREEADRPLEFRGKGRGSSPAQVILVKKKMQVFLRAFVKEKTVYRAAREACVSRPTINAWLKANRYGFRDAFEAAGKDAADEVEADMLDAKAKTNNPILHIFAAKAWKPEKYRDDEGKGGGDAKVQVVINVPRPVRPDALEGGASGLSVLPTDKAD